MFQGKLVREFKVMGVVVPAETPVLTDGNKVYFQGYTGAESDERWCYVGQSDIDCPALDDGLAQACAEYESDLCGNEPLDWAQVWADNAIALSTHHA